MSWPDQRERIEGAARALEALPQVEAVTILIDATGIGDVVFDDLDLTGLDIVPIKFTNDWKQKAVRLLAADLERGAAFILDEQRHEFESYMYELTDSGRYKFSAPEGGHDDEVSAKLLEHWGHVNIGSPSVALLDAGASEDAPTEVESDVVDGEVLDEVISLGPPGQHLLIGERGWD
jgi:hypothetical protein